MALSVTVSPPPIKRGDPRWRPSVEATGNEEPERKPTRDDIGTAFENALAAAEAEKDPAKRAVIEQDADDLAKAFQESEQPKTTVGGMAGAVARGLAPYAAGATTGATIGGAMGIPGGPAGMATGALIGGSIGTAAVGAEQLLGGIYNLGAMGFNAASDRLTNKPQGENVRLPSYSGLSGATDPVLTAMGVPEPDTFTEKMASVVSGGLSAKGLAEALKNIAKVTDPGKTRKLLNTMGSLSTRQGIGAGLATGTGVTLNELQGGGNSLGILQTPVNIAAPIVAGAAPFLYRGGKPSRAAFDAMNRGFIIPPVETTLKPSLMARILDSVGGRDKTRMLASVKNEPIIQAKVREDFGLRPDTLLTTERMASIRRNEGRVYNEASRVTAKDAPQSLLDFNSDIGAIRSPLRAARREAPTLLPNPKFDELINEFESIADDIRRPLVTGRELSSEAIVGLSRQFRANARANFTAIDPQLNELAKAQKSFAEALEKLLDRRIAGSKTPELGARLSSARERIAKSHAVEDSLVGESGVVDAVKLYNYGKTHNIKFTGKLKEIAEAAGVFGESLRPGQIKPGMTPLSGGEAATYTLPYIVEQAALQLGEIPEGLGATMLAIGAANKIAPPLARRLAVSRKYQLGTKKSIPKTGDLIRALTATGPTMIRRDYGEEK
jgi:hypothetical protein